MRIIRTIAEMRSLGGGDLGFVPTMGAFHEGHLSLMREARQHHKTVCVSLFVNPLQFGPNEDLEKYPRNEARDFELANSVGVDIVFAPSREEIYPRQSTMIHVAGLSDLWEGQVRPGHFDGVATVVAKLFNIVRPDIAYFGWKDLQQCLVINRMTEDLNQGVKLKFLDTVREPDGLAMSSRNAYLTPELRAKAPLLQRALGNLVGSFSNNAGDIDAQLENGRELLSSSGFLVDYLELVSLSDLRPVRKLDDAALIVAAKLGSTRLIDNVRLAKPGE